jgi:hypothetical protein
MANWFIPPVVVPFLLVAAIVIVALCRAYA